MNARVSMKSSLIVAIAVVAALGAVLIESSSVRLSNGFALANSSQVQETSITLDSENLREPYFLKITASPSLSYLSGSVSCNGKIIHLLGNQMTKINLSPYLKQGRNKVVIVGRYSPSNTVVDIELVSANSQVTQSTSGSGLLNQSILIEVQ